MWGLQRSRGRLDLSDESRRSAQDEGDQERAEELLKSARSSAKSMSEGSSEAAI